MILYSSTTSPYVRKILVLLHETDQLDAVQQVTSSTAPNNPTAGLQAKNPLMKIPALERPEGATLYDSRVICQFLDARGGGRLYPEGPRRWETLTLEATADGMLDAALLMTYESRLRPEDKRWETWVEAQWSKIEASCDALNTRWISHLSGPMDMGQIAVGCALGYVDFRHGARNWRAGRDALARWYDGFAARASMQATVPAD
ncbi:glutathione S-transferase [Primorskyibacter sp. S187A]|uniref:glutathione S-transferase n=1 Tax=Primorskyibacter sp. S187A TaxID=3415130 RepID=UPI003C7A009A